MSDTNAEEQNPPNYQQYLKLPVSRGARRVTFEEKLRQERELARDGGKYSSILLLAVLTVTIRTISERS